jgi:hypothetical protein
MTPLPAGSFAAGFTGEANRALPEALGCRDKTFLGRRSAALEIVATCALLEGTRAATGRSKTASATRIHLVRSLISILTWVQGSTLASAAKFAGCEAAYPSPFTNMSTRLAEVLGRLRRGNPAGRLAAGSRRR